MIRAAGILFITPDNRALFLKRGNGSDHPLEWAFPGGQMEDEDGDDAEATARRETLEETGRDVRGTIKLHTRAIAPAEIPALGAPEVASTAATPGVAAVLPAGAPPPAAVAPSEDVDFTTYLCRVDKEFVPTLCDEHTGWAWADVTTPPLPLHPGAQVALDRLTMNELGVARAMAAGRLTSPQKYENVWLFNLRVTGTGAAYRHGRREYVWRPPEIYMNDEFLARVAGLQVIFEHPEKAQLDSKEFNSRTIGALFLPYLRTDLQEVWAIAKIYDAPTAKLMSKIQISTSPGVVFRGKAAMQGNERLELASGEHILIEGDPTLWDHLAVCEAGVWDKDGGPVGVESSDAVLLNDAQVPLEPVARVRLPLDADKLARLDRNLKITRLRLRAGAA